MIGEHSRFRIGWDALIASLALISCVIISWQLVFSQDSAGQVWSFVYIIDLIFLADIALNFFTTYRGQGIEVVDSRKIAKHYVRTMLPVDILANFPWEIVLLFVGDGPMWGIPLLLWLRLPRLLRVVRLFFIFRRWESLPSANPGVLRVVRFGAAVMLVAHVVACLWFLTASMHGFPAGNWAEKAGIVSAAPLDQYVRSLYWTITTMTTVGFGDITPARTSEYMVAMMVMLLGASLYAFIVGSIASLLSGLNAERARHRDKVQTLAFYLQQRDVSPEIKRRVRSYYDYLWSKHRGVAEAKLLADLPRSLQIEIKTQLAKKVLQHVPLFRHCSPILRDELIAALELETFDPGSLVVQAGEKGRDIFFVVNGSLSVVGEGRDEPFAALEAGEYFGYLSVVLQERRTASVVADTFCDLLRLSQQNYDLIMEAYPEFREVLSKAAANKTEKMTELVLEGVVL